MYNVSLSRDLTGVRNNTAQQAHALVVLILAVPAEYLLASTALRKVFVSSAYNQIHILSAALNDARSSVKHSTQQA